MLLIEIVMTTLVTICLALATYIVRKFDKTIENFNQTQTALCREIALSHKRLDILDVIISAILKDSVSSSGISENKSDWPRHLFDSTEHSFHGPVNGKGREKK